MDITAPLALRNDVLIIPVSKLDEQTRRSIDCGEQDFAISRPHSRSTSTVIDPAAAALVEQFRKPRTIVEAVVLFSKARGLDGSAVLEDAYRLVRRLMEQDFIRPQGEADASQEADAVKPLHARGDRVAEAEVLRLLHLVEDTELYLARDPEWGPCVLKIERSGHPRVAALFEREAQVLEHVNGTVAPRLIRAGEHGGRRFLLLEHCRGLEAEIAAAEIRSSDEASIRSRVRLVGRIARAYAALHERGVCHGDVHPRNVLVDDGRVRLIDFGMARWLASEVVLPRGGVAFFFEPEAARCALEEAPMPPPTLLGEQYSVAALLYYLLTGMHYLEFSLGRLELMRQIVDAAPVPLAERGLDCPALEATLFRALAKDPAARFPTTSEFADALERLEPPPALAAVHAAARPEWPSGRAALDRATDEILERTALDGPWFTGGLSPGPSASVNYGAAGIALIVQRLARRRQDPALLARADAWARRADSIARHDPNAFVTAGGEISPSTVGEASPLHTASGVDLVRALVSHAAGDPVGHARAVAAFVAAAGGRTAGLDLTLGDASTILGAAQLLPTASHDRELVRALRQLAASRVARLWDTLDSKPAIAASDIDNLGIAHGWAGFVYATLLWCDISRTDAPEGALRRLRELAVLAEPWGRGLTWPWALAVGTDAAYMSGWCNGTAGHVHLWTLAHRLLGDPSCLDLAIGAGWDVWDAPDGAGTLCCGLAGRAYALLSLHRATGDRGWLARARVLGERAAAHGEFEPEYPHSLYKGRLVLAALAADLDCPEEASQPFFELEPC